ncbi:MAG: GerAB/ArcD/ProY family transporter, partial [Clostridia bacterium]
MQLKHDDKISSRQLSISISSVIIAVGVVTMPRTAVKVVGTADVWITLLLSGAIAMMIVYLCTKLMQRYPGQTFFEYNQRIVGKALGMLISFFFSCYWLMLAAYEARMNAEVIRFLLLERTPIEVTILSFMLVALYIVIKGQNPLVRLAHLVFPLTTIVLLTILLLGINKFHGSNFLPVASEGVWPIVKGIPVTSILYLGFEAILILGASVQDISKLPRAGLVGVFIPIVIYVITFVLVIGILSPEEVMTLVWPTIEVIKDIEFPGAFFANFEIVFIVVWVV